ncbi:MAG: penicillin-binding protein activator [Pseudomonadota bacterium]
MLNILYRFFAVIAIITVFSCAPLDEQQDEEKQPIESPIKNQKNIKAPEQKPEANQSSNNDKKDDYAPATKTKIEESKPPEAIIADPNYAAQTKIGEASYSKTVKVALLIPMSGDSESLGKSMLDAAVLAVYDKYSTLSSRETTAKVELLPKDTGDSIEQAEKATQDAIQEGAEIILGPLFSKQVSAVAGIAKSKKIPVVTFSNNVSVAGDGVYLFGFIPEQQVTRIVNYQLNKSNSNIAALVPSNPYGATIVKQLSTEVRKHGGRAHPIEYYSEDTSNLDNNVGRLSRFIQEEPNKNQALFIAEGGAKLKIISDTLFANGITTKNVQLIGTGLWNDTELLKIPNLFGGLFASSPPEKYSEFEKHFVATYSYKPERRASLSYDAAALAINIALFSKGNGFPKNIITDQVGFNGPANGIFRFHDDGTIERGLSVLMITNSGFKTIEPAPTTFNE